jgi:hypothetical protein
MTHLALDGPFNGTYLDELTAIRNDYSLTTWPTGEEVWVHGSSTHLLHPEDEQAIVDAVIDAELR